MPKTAKKKSPPSISETVVDQPGRTPARPTEDEIAARAYDIYLGRGGGEGNSVDDWLQAERELGAGSN